MNTFILGLLVGGAAVGIIAALVFINNKLKNVFGALQLLNAKIVKIEKITESTMAAAENFIDVLHSSFESVGFGPPRLDNSPGNPGDEFQDLRETFENGIRSLENEKEDEDDEDKEEWKKK